MQNDPDVGWHWFRSLSLRVSEFSLTDSMETGESCQDSEFTGLIEGALDDGSLEVSGMGLQGASSLLKGSFALSTSACTRGQCQVRLDSLRMSLKNFELGPYNLTDLEAHLVTPLMGEQRGAELAFTGGRMKLEIRGRLASTDENASDGDSFVVRVHATDTVTAMAAPDGSFAITELRVDVWPFETKLTASSSRSD